jgi:hypothetical protein
LNSITATNWARLKKAAFEHRLSSDPEFREHAELHQRAMAAIRFYGREQLQKKLQEISPPSAPKTGGKNKWPLIGASIIVLAVLVVYWFKKIDGGDAPSALSQVQPGTPR